MLLTDRQQPVPPRLPPLAAQLGPGVQALPPHLLNVQQPPLQMQMPTWQQQQQQQFAPMPPPIAMHLQTHPMYGR